MLSGEELRKLNKTRPPVFLLYCNRILNFSLVNGTKLEQLYRPSPCLLWHDLCLIRPCVILLADIATVYWSWEWGSASEDQRWAAWRQTDRAVTTLLYVQTPQGQSRHQGWQHVALSYSGDPCLSQIWNQMRGGMDEEAFVLTEPWGAGLLCLARCVLCSSKRTTQTENRVLSLLTWAWFMTQTTVLVLGLF